jgi:hypothetical protein
MESRTPKYKAWEVAEQAAQAAERDVLDLMWTHIKGQPTNAIDERQASALSLRHKAHRLFNEAMAETKGLSHALPRGDLRSPMMHPLQSREPSSGASLDATMCNASPAPTNGGDLAARLCNEMAAVPAVSKTSSTASLTA